MSSSHQGFTNLDLKARYGAVYLPYALERKYPNANREWGWLHPRPQLRTQHRTQPTGPLTQQARQTAVVRY